MPSKKIKADPDSVASKAKGRQKKAENKSTMGRKGNKYRSTDFFGKMKDLEGFYFDAMATNQADGFNRTKKAVLNFIACSSKIGPFVEESLHRDQLCCGALPVKPEDSTDDIEKAVHVEEIKIFAKQRHSVKNGLM
mmetsp:Transcript_10363/g.15194  ORF Transcript_10363/g.15194 Transcript_10363/m.15194 type:complete len:136 (-) Transcript_10363:5-412(-)